ncbi:zinc finger protein OZF-like [Zophobas morio]|uniref:zinc finger protein OZF-like n=1 Tax=Zophobas morio TaxID=2755281 RepID=UPI003083A6F8
MRRPSHDSFVYTIVMETWPLVAVFGCNRVTFETKRQRPDTRKINSKVQGKGRLPLKKLLSNLTEELAPDEYHPRSSSILERLLRSSPKKKLISSSNFQKESTLPSTDSSEFYTCKICLETFSKKKAYIQHRLLHQPKRYSCNVCGYTSFSPYSFHVHTTTHEVKRTFPCNLCSYRAKTEHYLKYHVITNHTKEYPYKCDSCDKGYISRSALRMHQKSSHENHYFVCEFCKNMYKNKRHYKQHLSIHSCDSAKKTYTCELCSKVFYDEGFLRQHVRKHVYIREPQVCDVCGKVFKNIEIHRLTHNEEKRHVCEVCGKSFHASHNLQSHMRVHTKEKPYRCDICGKTYGEASNLAVHRRVHTGEKPYKCEICTRGFISGSGLKVHVCQGFPG